MVEMTRTRDKAHLKTSPFVKELEVIPRIRAIYFLVEGDEVVYIGQTTDLVTVQDRHKDKSFDSMFYCPCPEEAGDLDTIEKACISYFWPRLNVAGRYKVDARRDRKERAESRAREFLGIATPEDYSMTVAADIVVLGFSQESSALKVLLIRRGVEPFRGRLALPGGRVEPGEDAETAALRELQEEVNIQPAYLEQLYTFSKPHRDPRGRVVSVAYLGLVNTGKFKLRAASDADEADWHDLAQVPSLDLAFDHQEIIEKAVERVQGKVRYTPIGFDLLPKKFTIGDLRRLYEAILGRELDPSNFRKKVLDLGVLGSTGTTRKGGHRPATLYSFNWEAYQKALKKGINFEV